MKKQFNKYFLIMAMICVCTAAANAQQKASDRRFEEELRKVNEKKAARDAFISKMRQSTPVENQGEIPADQKINMATKPAVDPKPATANQAPANLKPSQQPMGIPKKPAEKQ